MRHAFVRFPIVAKAALISLFIAGCAAQPAAQQASAPPRATLAPSGATPAGLPPSEVAYGQVSLGMSMDDALKKYGATRDSGRDAHGAAYYRYVIAGGDANLTLYSAPFRPGYLYGLQITGNPSAGLPPVAGVHLGDGAFQVLSLLGEPASRDPVPGKERTLWTYADRNYAFELSDGGDVISLRVYGYAGVMLAQAWPAVWERYRPDSISGATSADRAGWQDGSVYVASAGVPFRPRVTFTGDVRDTSQDVLDEITAWARTSPDAVSAGMYTKSIRVVDNGASYWLPIQSDRLKPFQDAVKPGDAVDLFVIWLGAGNGGADPALIVNEFCTCSWAPPQEQ